MFSYIAYHFIRKLENADQLIKCIKLKIGTSISNQIFVSDTNVPNFYDFWRAKWILQTTIEKSNLVCKLDKTEATATTTLYGMGN